MFCKTVPVVIRQQDREDKARQLSIRILYGTGRSTPKVLRIQLTSPSDVFFLHTLELTEEDFIALKLEQGILVDFASFPTNIVGLLERCLCGEHEDVPRFQAILSVHGCDSSLRIVENNDFKQLAHICLTFRLGNDSAVKQFLASRLCEVTSDYSETASKLQDKQDQLSLAMQQLADAKHQLLAHSEQHQRQLSEQAAAAERREALAAERSRQEMAHLRAQLDRDRVEVQEHAERQQAILQSRNKELDSMLGALRVAMTALESRAAELSQKLGAADVQCSSLREQLSSVQSSESQLSQDVRQKDAEISQLRIKLSTAEAKVTGHNEVTSQLRERIRELETTAKTLEARCNEFRDAAAGHEQRAKTAGAELLQSHHIVDKLTSDLRATKDKLKRKQVVLEQQEEELVQQQRAAVQAAAEAADAQRSLLQTRRDGEELQAENNRLKQDLVDCQQQLRSNEQMIRWLNNQVNEAQLGGGCGMRSTPLMEIIQPNAPPAIPPSASWKHEAIAAGRPAALGPQLHTTAELQTKPVQNPIFPSHLLARSKMHSQLPQSPVTTLRSAVGQRLTGGR